MRVKLKRIPAALKALKSPGWKSTRQQALETWVRELNKGRNRTASSEYFGSESTLGVVMDPEIFPSMKCHLD
jgi:hypothetical protein